MYLRGSARWNATLSSFQLTNIPRATNAYDPNAHSEKRNREIEGEEYSGRDCSLKPRRANIYRNVHYSFSSPRPAFDTVSANGFPGLRYENTREYGKRRIEKERNVNPVVFIKSEVTR